MHWNNTLSLLTTYIHEYYNNVILLLKEKFEKNEIIYNLYVEYSLKGEIMVDIN